MRAPPESEDGAFRAWRRAAGSRPLVLGHRGARHGAPENTLRAFDLARSEGADGVELDVRLSADGVVVVAHDVDLRRVTGRRDTRRVRDLSARQLAAVDLGDGATMPALHEVLRWARRHDQRVNVELKQDSPHLVTLCRRVAELLAAEPDAPERFILSSFHPGMVLALRQLLPAVPSAWLLHAGQRWVRAARAPRLPTTAAVHPEHALLDPRRMTTWRRSGMLVNTWTVNSAQETRRVASLGVDAIITDIPHVVLCALRGA